jgi:hypothetical protein
VLLGEASHGVPSRVSTGSRNRQNKPICRGFLKPSDGLEPSTPSLPSSPGPLRTVASRCELACFEPFSPSVALPLVATGCARWAP